MRALGRSHAIAVAFSLTLHALVLGLANGYWVTDRSFTPKFPKEQIVLLNLLPAKEQESISPDAPSDAPEPSPAQDQGVVRFRVEITPDGSLAKLETLWTTSAVAEQLARRAIETMPPLPATPTGKPLIFEKTISFTPYANDGPPSYRDDCIPDPPAFRNPFAWDGKSPQMRAAPPKAEKLDPQAMEECLRQLPRDSIEAETARDQRAMERWGWSK